MLVTWARRVRIAFAAMLVVGMWTTSCGVFKPGACRSSRGLVILAGNELRPPFVIETIDSVLCINGLRTPRVERPVPQPTSKVVARHALRQSIFRDVDFLRGRVPDSVIVARALAHLKASGLVDSAKTGGYGDFGVWWQGERWAEGVDLGLHQPPDHRSPRERERERRRRTEENLRSRRTSLCRSLQMDRLVIIGRGTVMTMGKGPEVMEEIARARRGLPGRSWLPESVRAELRRPVPLERARK